MWQIHVANTAGIEQRSKFQNELTKKKQTGDYPKQATQSAIWRRWG